ncbi:MAG: hypothetical protein P1V35_13515, partial [Planctomycetota bacterium]|nr:hypothetical protein [Planctomycetota bacterium]
YALSRFGIFLRDMDDPMRAFNQLKADTKHKATLKTILLWNNLERMVAYRRYDDILRHLPDPKSAIEARMAAIVIKEKGLEMELQSDLPRPPGATKPAPTEADSEIPKIQPERQLPGVKQARIPMVLDSALLYECLLATGKEDKAHELMVMVTDFEPTGNTYAMFIERTNRLGKIKIRTALAERGSERVPEDEIWRITNMVIRGTRGGK